jgi:hypothetical protein
MRAFARRHFFMSKFLSGAAGRRCAVRYRQTPWHDLGAQQRRQGSKAAPLQGQRSRAGRLPPQAEAEVVIGLGKFHPHHRPIFEAANPRFFFPHTNVLLRHVVSRRFREGYPDRRLITFPSPSSEFP